MSIIGNGPNQEREWLVWIVRLSIGGLVTWNLTETIKVGKEQAAQTEIDRQHTEHLRRLDGITDKLTEDMKGSLQRRQQFDDMTVTVRELDRRVDMIELRHDLDTNITPRGERR